MFVCVSVFLCLCDGYVARWLRGRSSQNPTSFFTRKPPEVTTHHVEEIRNVYDLFELHMYGSSAVEVVKGGGRLLWRRRHGMPPAQRSAFTVPLLCRRRKQNICWLDYASRGARVVQGGRAIVLVRLTRDGATFGSETLAV